MTTGGEGPTGDRRRGLTTPQAVLGAGVLIAVALFFGLRRPASAPAPEAPVPAAASATGAEATARPPPAAQVQPRARQLAQRAVDAQRAALASKCGADGGVEPARGRLQLAFDVQGRQMARGLHVDRSEPRGDVLQCAEAAMQPLAIEALGVETVVEVDLVLP